MPATAGRVRMPANNRVHSSAALQTHGIWQSAIGYDPYAPTHKEEPSKSEQKSEDPENAYASFQGLLALARITGSNNNDEARGACKKCGRVGHLTFQCRNFLSVKDDNEKDPDAIQAAVMSGLEKIKSRVGKGENKKGVEESSDEDEEDSESSDSEVDSEMERIIAKRSGKKLISKGKSSSSSLKSINKKKRHDDSDEDESDSDSRRRRRRSKRRSSHRRRVNSDSEDEKKRKRRKEKRRRKRDESDDSSSSESETDDDYDRSRHKRKSRKEKRRRRSHHRYSDSSDSDTPEDKYGRREKRRNKVAESSDSDAGVSGDKSRAGRGSVKRSHKSRRGSDE